MRDQESDADDDVDLKALLQTSEGLRRKRVMVVGAVAAVLIPVPGLLVYYIPVSVVSLVLPPALLFTQLGLSLAGLYLTVKGAIKTKGEPFYILGACIMLLIGVACLIASFYLFAALWFK